jgi:hypothetical protein
MKGFAHDISAGGIFINSGERPPAGALMTLEISLPVREHGQKLQLHGTGRVVRWAENSTHCGFAIAKPMAWTLSRRRNQVATVPV